MFKTNDIQTVLYFDHINNWPLGQTTPTNRENFINFVKQILFTINPTNMKLNGIKNPFILVHSRFNLNFLNACYMTI